MTDSDGSDGIEPFPVRMPQRGRQVSLAALSRPTDMASGRQFGGGVEPLFMDNEAPRPEKRSTSEEREDSETDEVRPVAGGVKIRRVSVGKHPPTDRLKAGRDRHAADNCPENVVPGLIAESEPFALEWPTLVELGGGSLTPSDIQPPMQGAGEEGDDGCVAQPEDR